VRNSGGGEQYDFAVIGAGAAGEAAAHHALDRGASVVVIERELFGGSCAYWACIPSKALLHAAAIHAAGGDFPWTRAAEFRDWAINRRDGELPDDSGHVQAIEGKGGVAIRGEARLAGHGTVLARDADGTQQLLSARHVILAVGSHSKVPDIPGLPDVPYWTNRQATSTRELPGSLLILGGGPTGVEMAQVYARYGVPSTLVDANPRILARDHPLTSEVLSGALARDGVRVLTGVRATSAHAGGGRDGAHRFDLDDGSSVEGHAVLLAIGRSYPLEGLGLETVGVELAGDGLPKVDASLQVAPEVYLAGDPAGPEMHTHLAHYEGELAARIALGDEVVPDFRAIPRATYTDPETSSVGLTVEQATEQGVDALERTIRLADAAKGIVSQSEGHVTVVVDSRRRTLLGCFMAGPGVSEAIHEAVLAVKLQVPLHILADTLHAFPTVARVLGTLFIDLSRELAPEAEPEV
jgi:pyruvate/2-oxoglutarate dehydrogenase complex dihydrolipoamide dehydrogenase (E3) component